VQHIGNPHRLNEKTKCDKTEGNQKKKTQVYRRTEIGHSRRSLVLIKGTMGEEVGKARRARNFKSENRYGEKTLVVVRESFIKAIRRVRRK